MSIWKKSSEKTGLEAARDEALVELRGYEAHEDIYKEIMIHVKTLTELIESQRSERLNPNTIAVILGNAVIALVVVGYESKNIMTTRVHPFLMKMTR